MDRLQQDPTYRKFHNFRSAYFSRTSCPLLRQELTSFGTGTRTVLDPTATLASPPSLLSAKCGSKINPIHVAKERILLTCMGFRITVGSARRSGSSPKAPPAQPPIQMSTRADDCDKSWIGCGSGNFPPGVAEQRLKPDCYRLFEQAVISHGARHGT